MREGESETRGCYYEEVILNRGHKGGGGALADQAREEGSPQRVRIIDDVSEAQPATKESVLDKHPSTP